MFERFVRLPFTAPPSELIRAVAILREAWDGREQAKMGQALSREAVI
ncbi:hypothetical protein [Leucobacter luti]|nr:hypothetical protein [Leucobacter luti]